MSAVSSASRALLAGIWKAGSPSPGEGSGTNRDMDYSGLHPVSRWTWMKSLVERLFTWDRSEVGQESHRLVRHIGRTGHRRGQLDRPCGVAVTETGIYSHRPDLYQAKIQEYSD